MKRNNSQTTIIQHWFVNWQGFWLQNKLRARTGESNWKMITFLKHMCSIDPPVWEEVWQTFWARVQSPAEIRNRLLGLSSIILSFGKHAQPFLTRTAAVAQSAHTLPYTPRPNSQTHMRSTHTQTHLCFKIMLILLSAFNYGRCDCFVLIS